MNPFSHRRVLRLGCALTGALALVLCAAPGRAACNGADINADTPSTRFQVSGDSVTDTATGLIWKRCAEGLSGAGCTGTAFTGTWGEALARVATVNASPATLGDNQSDWRLPNRNELASLVERKCVAPAINTGVFAGTPAQSFWTASPYALNGAAAWYVDFNAGDVAVTLKSASRNIRLVRAGN